MSIEARVKAEEGRKAVTSEHQKRSGRRISIWRETVEGSYRDHIVPLIPGPDSSF